MKQVWLTLLPRGITPLTLTRLLLILCVVIVAHYLPFLLNEELGRGPYEDVMGDLFSLSIVPIIGYYLVFVFLPAIYLLHLAINKWLKGIVFIGATFLILVYFLLSSGEDSLFVFALYGIPLFYFLDLVVPMPGHDDQVEG